MEYGYTGVVSGLAISEASSVKFSSKEDFTCSSQPEIGLCIYMLYWNRRKNFYFGKRALAELCIAYVITERMDSIYNFLPPFESLGVSFPQVFRVDPIL